MNKQERIADLIRWLNHYKRIDRPSKRERAEAAKWNAELYELTKKKVVNKPVKSEPKVDTLAQAVADIERIFGKGA